jgi:cytochrome c556
MRQFVLWTGGRLASAACAALLAAGTLGSVALSQEQAMAPPKDAIFARKILMDTIGHNMDELDGILGAAKLDLNEGHEHADMISVMLMAFPHLFPPATNQWKAGAERDPGTDTFAAPEVWTNFADFYKRAQDASKVAYKASRADTEAEFKDFVAQLRVACDSCHGAYMKPE